MNARRLLDWALVVLYMAALFYASSRPSLPEVPYAGFDKVEHFGAYGVLGVLCYRAFAATWGGRRWVALGAWVLAVAYGASDELHQHFVPGRTMDAMDLLADALGAAGGVLLAALLWGARRVGQGAS